MPLKEIQHKAALLLASGRRCKDVACEVQVAAETISIWRRDPEFRTRCAEIRDALFRESFNTLRAGLSLAADELVQLASHSESDETRRKASTALIKLFVQNPSLFAGMD
jgi:hypothetical protein